MTLSAFGNTETTNIGPPEAPIETPIETPRDASPEENEDFAKLFKESQSLGRCRVQVTRVGQATMYIPTDRSNSKAKYNILGWGNGSLMGSKTYKGVLESIASQCIFVAAANSASAGSGRDIQNAIKTARTRYVDKILANPRVCTSGHSQGGGGAFNAAKLSNADCVISVQADVSMTSHINEPIADHIEVIALWGNSDVIAPEGPANLESISKNSKIVASVKTKDENHFTIMSDRGGNIGTLFRMAAKAQLSIDPKVRAKFRKAFWGPETLSSINTDVSHIMDVKRNSGAVNRQP